MKREGATLALCKSTVLEHAYFGNGSSLKFYVDKSSFAPGDLLKQSHFIPIYAQGDMAGWIEAKCLGVLNDQIAFEAVALYSADFQVPAGSHTLILAL